MGNIIQYIVNDGLIIMCIYIIIYYDYHLFIVILK